MTYACRRVRPLSIQSLVAASVLLPTLTIAALLVWLGDSTARRLSRDLGDRILSTATDRTRQLVENYLGDAVHTGDLFSRRVTMGTLGAADLGAWRAPALDAIASQPRVAAITFGTAADDAFYLQRTPTGLLEVCAARGDQAQDRQFVIGLDGALSAEPNRVYDYHPSQRPWFIEATSKPCPRWTQIYTWFANAHTDATTGLAYVQTVGTREPRRVVCVDVTIDDLSKYLRTLLPSPASSLFIVDENGRLVAGTRDGEIVAKDGSRASLAQHPDALAAALGDAIGRRGPALAAETFDVAGGAQRVQLARLAPYPGIEWKIVAATPEAELLRDAWQTRTRSILAAIVVVAGGAFFAIVTARRIARPIVSVGRHVQRVAGGDLDARIAVGGARELVDLSDGLNAMSADLKNRVELVQSLRLATAVQQSLLPRRAPTFERLDVFGVSRYCDSTGGDYFDFIELVRGDANVLLLAIGDVMGHGIGSAMMMASARGALRASLLEDVDLAHAITRVNRTLLQSDAGLFMTMTLMRVDAVRGSATWASAGHDPAIVFDPADGSFRELDGADLPLGLMDAEYLSFHAHGLRPGMVLIAGTDGIWEMMNAGLEEYGKDRMKATVAANATRPASEIGAALEADLAAFRGGSPVRDDVTYVVVRFV